MPWQWEISGEELDLRALDDTFSERSPTVERRDDGAWLVYDHSVATCDHDQATSDLRRMNGWIRAESRGHVGATLTGRYIDPEGGAGVVVGPVTFKTRAYMSVKLSGGTAMPQPGPVLLSKAEVDVAVADVLDLLGTCDDAFVILYKIYEVIRDELGGDRGIEAAGLSTKAEISAFTATMNRPDVSGGEARHARSPGNPPRRAMTVAEAQAFARGLAAKFLRSRAT